MSNFDNYNYDNITDYLDHLIIAESSSYVDTVIKNKFTYIRTFTNKIITRNGEILTPTYISSSVKKDTIMKQNILCHLHGVSHYDCINDIYERKAYRMKYNIDKEDQHKNKIYYCYCLECLEIKCESRNKFSRYITFSFR